MKTVVSLAASLLVSCLMVAGPAAAAPEPEEPAVEKERPVVEGVVVDEPEREEGASSREELLELSVGQLKKLARDRGVDVSTALEKAHIVDALVSAREE